MNSIKKVTGSLHHSEINTITKLGKEFYNMSQERGQLVLNPISRIISFSNLDTT